MTLGHSFHEGKRESYGDDKKSYRTCSSNRQRCTVLNGYRGAEEAEVQRAAGASAANQDP